MQAVYTHQGRQKGGIFDVLESNDWPSRIYVFEGRKRRLVWRVDAGGAAGFLGGCVDLRKADDQVKLLKSIPATRALKELTRTFYN